jgi:hypothetical protein
MLTEDDMDRSDWEHTANFLQKAAEIPQYKQQAMQLMEHLQYTDSNEMHDQLRVPNVAKTLYLSSQLWEKSGPKQTAQLQVYQLADDNYPTNQGGYRPRGRRRQYKNMVNCEICGKLGHSIYKDQVCYIAAQVYNTLQYYQIPLSKIPQSALDNAKRWNSAQAPKSIRQTILNLGLTEDDMTDQDFEYVVDEAETMICSFVLPTDVNEE